MKSLHLVIAAIAVSLSACSTAPSPTAPTAAQLISGIDLSFYRAFLQNGYESPARLEPVRLLRGPVRIYMRTQDDGGRAIDAITLNTTEQILIESAQIWSGHTFGISEVARGNGTREGAAGWITVKWSAAASPDRCGNSTVGADGGFIEFNVSGSCSCGLATSIYPRLVRHELGHAMGYYHTDDRTDVMYGRTITPDACNLLPSDRERRLAQFAHTEAR